MPLLYGYGYSKKNSPISIKFLINIDVPLTLEPDYWYKIKNDKILEDVEPINIEEVKLENKKLSIYLKMI